MILTPPWGCGTLITSGTLIKDSRVCPISIDFYQPRLVRFYYVSFFFSSISRWHLQIWTLTTQTFQTFQTSPFETPYKPVENRFKTSSKPVQSQFKTCLKLVQTSSKPILLSAFLPRLVFVIRSFTCFYLFTTVGTEVHLQGCFVSLLICSHK